MIFITSYNRSEMLLNLLKSLKGEMIYVFDDGSNFNCREHSRYCREFIRTKRRGKRGFWILYNMIFDYARNSSDKQFIFIPDDLINLDLLRLYNDMSNYHQLPYAINILNIDRKTETNWGVPSQYGYIDCAFATNRKTLTQLQYCIYPVSMRRFKRQPNISSGVGRQLTQRMYERGIKIIMPEKSYAEHGDHPSIMHPEERLINPQITV